MENKRQQSGASSLDHLFGPRDSSSSPSSSSSSSSSSSVFGSIFSPPSMGLGKDPSRIMGNQAGNGKSWNPDNSTQSNKGGSTGMIGKDTSSIYQNETPEPCYFSSSIYYGGQENYSPRTNNSESHHIHKKDDRNDDPNGNNSNSASRGNWWQGSLYY